MKHDYALICKALAPAGLFAPVIREMELWEVGLLLGADEAPLQPRLILPRESVDPAAPRPAVRLAEVD